MPRGRNVARRPAVPLAAEPPPPDDRSRGAGHHPFRQGSGMPRPGGPLPPDRRRPPRSARAPPPDSLARQP
ncbi:hypothetical protein EBL87_08300 [Cereibacter sphaeroides]|nr:hypothetical protein EBL87_08300 [Cereibacter sphaeroides]AZB68344.1 hypothetical protein EBL86_08175 [Cereibacter sphaeroides]